MRESACVIYKHSVFAVWTHMVSFVLLKKKDVLEAKKGFLIAAIYIKWRSVSVAQLVASVSGVVLGGVAMVVGSSLARGKIFTASIGSVDSLYPSVFIYCMNLHQFLILCSSKSMMFVKLYLRTSDIYLVSLVSLDPSGFHLRTK